MLSPLRTPLILLGASVRAAAFSAWRGGFAPWGIDQFADADLAELCPARRVDDTPSNVLDAFRAAPDAPWMYTGGIENLPDLVHSLSELRPLLGNDATTLRHVRDPFELANRLSCAGWPTLAVLPGTHPPLRGTWMRKPLRSGGGIGIRAVDPERSSLEASADVYFQQRLPSSAPIYGATYVMAAGRSRLLGVCRQYSGFPEGEGSDLFPPFLYRGSVTVDMTGPRWAELRRLGELLAHCFPLRGVVGVDIARHEHSWRVLEVNPRFPASAELLESASRPSVVALHVASCVTGRISEEDPAPPFSARAKWIVYARDDLVWTAGLMRGWRAAVAGSPTDSPQIADVPASDTKIAAGHPVCTLLWDGSSGDDAVCAMRVWEQRVQAAIQDARAVRAPSVGIDVLRAR